MKKTIQQYGALLFTLNFFLTFASLGAIVYLNPTIFFMGEEQNISVILLAVIFLVFAFVSKITLGGSDPSTDYPDYNFDKFTKTKVLDLSRKNKIVSINRRFK